MLDMHLIRSSLEEVKDALKYRLSSLKELDDVVDTDKKSRAVLWKLEEKRALRNQLSQRQSKPFSDVQALKQEIQTLNAQYKELQHQLQEALFRIPNLPLPSVPQGEGKASNVVLRQEGSIRNFPFKIQNHMALGARLGGMDFATAAKIAGARFVVLSGTLARMERALIAFMLDIHTKRCGYTEVSVPLLSRTPAMEGTGQLPKFHDDQFQTTRGEWLIPTGEVPLTNMVRETILSAADLPLRFTTASPCFRQEAGAAGKETHGLIRQHQFYKVELVSIVSPEEGESELERMRACAEIILKELCIPYRVVLLSRGEMGFSACKSYDLEVWIPSQQTYREISSCSLCGDFQSRRMSARVKVNKTLYFPHTLNGSGVAVGRLMVALLENYQEKNGAITLPDALHPYMPEHTTLTPPS